MEEQPKNDYITIGDAAKFLGVTAETLRNWDKAGKLVAYRHPINQYRLYSKATLVKLIQRIENDHKSD